VRGCPTAAAKMDIHRLPVPCHPSLFSFKVRLSSVGHPVDYSHAIWGLAILELDGRKKTIVTIAEGEQERF